MKNLSEKILFAIIIVAVCAISISLYYNEYNRLEPVKGNFKKSIKYEYSVKRGKITKEQISSGLELYNSKGELTEKFQYNDEGSIWNKNTYKYNDNGKLIEETQYESDGSIYIKNTRGYDDNGKLIEKVKYRSNGSIIDTMI